MEGSKTMTCLESGEWYQIPKCLKDKERNVNPLNFVLPVLIIPFLVFVISHRSIVSGVQTVRSHKSRAAVDYTPIGVEPHGPTRGVWPIATVANDSQLHLVASSI